MIASRMSKFPTELIDEIAQLSSTSELIALSQTSTRVNSVATRVLYKTLMFRSAVTAIKCFQAIISRPSCALAIRTLSLAFRCDSMLSGFYKLAAAVIELAVYLVRLSVGDAYPLLDLLRTTPLAHLSECELVHVPEVGPFLQNHTTVEHLVVYLRDQGFADSLSPIELPPLCLPKLAWYLGPAAMAPGVMPGSVTRCATLLWANEPNFETVLASLVSSNNTLELLDNFLPEWNGDLLTAIAAYLPGLRTLRVRGFCMINQTYGLEEFYTVVENSLKSFESLTMLDISTVPSLHRPTLSGLDKEFDMVTRWGEQCPSLLICALPSGAVWAQVEQHVWFPDIHGRHASLGHKWKLRAVAAVKFPLKVYAGLKDADGHEITPKLKELLGRGVRYPMRHLKLKSGGFDGDNPGDVDDDEWESQYVVDSSDEEYPDGDEFGDTSEFEENEDEDEDEDEDEL